jgi:hypothetical protein
LSDEKTLFNKDNNSDDNMKNEEKQVHPVAVEEDSDLVDFSSAFDGEDDVVLNEIEEYKEPVSKPSLFSAFSFLKRRKEKHEKEEIKEELEPQVEENLEDSVANEEKEEIIVEEKQEKRKKFKGFSPFAKKEKEPEISTEERTETEEIAQEEPTEESVVETVEKSEQPEETTNEVVVLEEPDDVEKTEESGEEIALVEDFQEETENDAEETVETEDVTVEEEIAVEEPKPEKRRTAGFDFLKRKLKDSSVQKEETIEEPEQVEEVVETVEETAEEPEIEMIPSFEESTQEVKDSEQVEETVETTQEDIEKVEEAEIEEIPPFEEETNEDDVVESPVEETATEEVELIPPFEATVEENTAENSEEQPETNEKEEKTEVTEKTADEQSEKSTVQLLTTKDHVTFILIIIALLLTIVFIVVKFIPLGNNDTQDSGVVTQAKEKVSEIQIQRESAVGHYVQSDLDDVFYVYSAEYTPAFYQCNGNKMKPIEIKGTLNPIVEMGNEKMSVKVDYIEMGGKLFGTGVFRKTDNQGNHLNDMVFFKLVNLPKGYEQNGKALLLATTNSEAISKRCSMWNDSYVIDLATGKTTRFLTSDNSVYSAGYSLLTDEGYASTNGEIPFFSTRDYDATTNKRDIYLKVNGKETRFATDVAGSFVYTDAGAVSYLKVVDAGFNVVRKENGKEKVIFSLDNNTSYLYHDEYLLDKYNGNLYNVKTGEKTVVTGYGMSNPEMMTVSSDGRYLVVVGAVNSAIDYQVHIFDLKTGDCAKYVDDNFSQHKNLAFVNDTVIIYSAVEPKQGYEYVILDVSKAF